MNLRRFEHALLALGATICVASLGVLGYREICSRMAIRSFEAAASGSQKIQTPVPVLEVGVAQPDYNLWSPKRISAYRDSLARQFTPAVGILRIPKLGVEVPVFDGTDEWVLNRGVGRIIGSTRVGESGNIGIAGHRDGFFSSAEGHRSRRPDDDRVVLGYDDLCGGPDSHRNAGRCKRTGATGGSLGHAGDLLPLLPPRRRPAKIYCSRP